MKPGSDADPPRYVTTDGEIAVINLESARGRSWSRFFADPARPGAAEAVLEQEQMALQFIGEVSALDRIKWLAAELAGADASSASTALVQAQAASIGHRFAEARRHLLQAETCGASPVEVRHVQMNIDQACGNNLDSLMAERRELAEKSRQPHDLIAFASLLADTGDFVAADQAFRLGLREYRDVSPFPVAFVFFQLGMLWGEADRRRAADWYRRTIDVLPAYKKARIHLAEIYTSQGRLADAEALLTPTLSSGDPEVSWRLADIAAALAKSGEREAHLQTARYGYDVLLERHLLAFADHGAEFYAGSGGDLRRALDLARVNIANRPTLQGFELGHAIAISSGDNCAAIELLQDAKDRWGDTAAFRRSSFGRRELNRLEGAPRAN